MSSIIEAGRTSAGLLEANILSRAKVCEFTRYDPKAMFSAGFLLELAHSLTLDEVSIILNAEEIRELGLSEMRVGNLDLGREHMEASVKIVAGAGCLSEHAVLCIETFHHAAESFLHYKLGNATSAVASLALAISAAELLHARYGHEMQFRKIHLARNVLRVECRHSNWGAQLERVTDLIRFCDGDASKWPLESPPSVSSKVALGIAELAWALDEICMILTVDELGGLPSSGLIERACASGPEASKEIRAALAGCACLAWSKIGKTEAATKSAQEFFLRQSGGLLHLSRAIEAVMGIEH